MQDEIEKRLTSEAAMREQTETSHDETMREDNAADNTQPVYLNDDQAESVIVTNGEKPFAEMYAEQHERGGIETETGNEQRNAESNTEGEQQQRQQARATDAKHKKDETIEETANNANSPALSQNDEFMRDRIRENFNEELSDMSIDELKELSTRATSVVNDVQSEMTKRGTQGAGGGEVQDHRKRFFQS